MSQVESNGIRVDVPYLSSTIKQVEEKIRTLESKIRNDSSFRFWRRRFGTAAKIGSRTQLADIVFNDLGYKSKEVTATGRAKMDRVALEGIDDPLVKMFLEVEKLKKVNSTFLKSLQRETVNGFFHPNFNLTSVRSFRSSAGSDKEAGMPSRDFNVQTIPVRDEEQANIVRRCFVAREGFIPLAADFKSIEVVIAACLHKDPNMIRYLNDPNSDMHRDTAAKVFMLKPDQISKDVRYSAKNQVVFPFFYGSYYVDCARHLWEHMERRKYRTLLPNDDKKNPTGPMIKEHLARKGINSLGECDPEREPVKGTFEYHMREVERHFWDTMFPVYRDWKKEQYRLYQSRAWFDLITGFRIEGDYRRNQVVNYPVQGPAFHCLLWCLIQLQKWLNKYKMKTLIVCETHDSENKDVWEKEYDDVVEKTRQIMSKELPKTWPWIILPMSVEFEKGPVGGNWSEMKPLEG